MLKTFHKGGIHPPEYKLTTGFPIKSIPASEEYMVALSQHIGAPATCCVNVGDHVAKYQLIGTEQGFVSANVHSPVSGTVKKIEKIKTAFGFETTAVIIRQEGDDIALRNPRTQETVAQLTADKIVKIIDAAGIVGLGGATFPTRVKLLPPKGTEVDTLVINGAECEPFLTNDHELMLTYPEQVIEGTRLLQRAINAQKAVIAIEENKRDAIKVLTEAASGYDDVEITALKTKYPQGGEKQLIDATLNRQIPSGGLPASVGVVVQNVATAYAVWNAVVNDIPLTERIVTVTGPNVSQPGNYMVPIGTPLSAVIEAAGGIPDNTAKVILGGPMMGKAASNLNAPTTKGVSGILILPDTMSKREEPENCVRCASCVSVCPMGLEPYLLARLSELKNYERLEQEHVMDCIECGSCSFICISHRPILDYIRIGKMRTGAIIKSRKSDNNKK